MEPPFLTLNAYLRRRFGFRVQKIPLDAGLTCPNRDGTRGRGGCIYCDPHGSGTGAAARGLSIREQMEQGVEWARRRYRAKGFIAYFQSFSNTYGDPLRLRQLYQEAMEVEGVVGLAVATRPDCLDGEVLDAILQAARGRLAWVELGLQSGHDSTLALLNRGHTVAEFREGVELVHAFGLPVCAHLIFGLPGEDRRMMMESVELLKGLGVEGVKFHQLYCLEGTVLAGWLRSGRYRPLELEEYADLVAEAICRLGRGVVIHRLNGDPPRQGLLAPLWSREKALIRERVVEAVRQRNRCS